MTNAMAKLSEQIVEFTKTPCTLWGRRQAITLTQNTIPSASYYELFAASMSCQNLGFS